VKLDKSDIRYHLSKLLESEPFKASPTSSRLLTYLVEEALAGRSERLKGYSIGVDVFDRGAAFDAGSDSIVRVQMRRLRHLLSEYYMSESGKSAKIVIALEKGSYAPHFDIAELPNGDAIKSTKPNKILWFAGAAFVLLASLGLYLGYAHFRSEARIEPRIFVAQFSAIDRNPESILITRGLQHDLISLISQYPHLAVLGYETVAGEGNSGKISQLFGADYILSGSVNTGGGVIKVSSELTAVRTGLVVWSDTTEHRYTNAGDVLRSQTEIAARVGTVLGQPEGVIQQASKALVAESRGVSFTNYACIISVYEYKRRKIESVHREMRRCLEKATAENRNYASAWALLSWIYGDEFRYGFNAGPKSSSGNKALEAAEKGVRSNPFSATAHQYHAIALFYAGRDAEASRAIGNALRLSPNNAEILADAGWQSALAGADEKARAYFDEALKLNPDPPTWYWGGLAIDAIRREDRNDARRFSELYTNDGVLSLYVKAAALRLNGLDEDADRTLQQVAVNHPGLEKWPNGFLLRNRIDARLARWIFGESFQE
jgi:adenylate cyclase